MSSIAKSKRSRSGSKSTLTESTATLEIVFSHEAPKSVRNAQRDEGFAAAWPRFVKSLSRRKCLKAERWAVSLRGGLGEFFPAIAKKRSAASSAAQQAVIEFVQKWLSDVQQCEFTPASAEEVVQLATLLPRLGSLLPQTDWLSLHQQFWQLAVDAQKPSADVDAVVAQLLSVELPLLLAAILPEVVSPSEVVEQSQSLLKASLAAVSEQGAGLTNAALRQYGPLVESWTRSFRLADWPTSDARQEIASALKQAVKLGLQMTSPTGAIAWDTLEESSFTKSARLAGEALRCRKIPKIVSALTSPQGSSANKIKLPAATHLEAASLAALRAKWSPSEPHVVVRYAEGATRLEVSADRTALLSGIWNLQLSFAGSAAKQTSPWTNSFWITDEDVDFLEIQAEFEAGLRVDRQILLTKDGLLLLADCVMAPQSGPLRYESHLPLAALITPTVDEKMREIELVNTKRHARTMPLALPEWRSAPSVGALGIAEGAITLQQEIVGAGLYAPLAIDLNPSRLKKDFTWRQLTVASHLQTCEKDTAVGFRIHCGEQQWLLYRSLAKPVVRSVLAQQLLCEFMLARFLPSGKIKKLIEIE